MAISYQVTIITPNMEAFEYYATRKEALDYATSKVNYLSMLYLRFAVTVTQIISNRKCAYNGTKLDDISRIIYSEAIDDNISINDSNNEASDDDNNSDEEY
jgi:hypothetical protein